MFGLSQAVIKVRGNMITVRTALCNIYSFGIVLPRIYWKDSFQVNTLLVN